MRLNRIVFAAAVAIAALGGPWFVAQWRSLPQAHHLAARADQRIVTIAVAGMRSDSCERDIAAGLAMVDGVMASEVRRGMERAYVVVRRDLSDARLVAAIEQAGRGYRAQVVAK